MVTVSDQALTEFTMSKDRTLLVVLMLALCLAGCQAPRQMTVEVQGYGAGARVTFNK